MRSIAAIASLLALVSTLAVAQNRVMFSNHSGEQALVRLIGPASRDVEVSANAQAEAYVAAGKYTYNIRWGMPGQYRYSEGQEFEVQEKTATTIVTLPEVPDGNYQAQRIPEAEFGASPSPTPSDSAGQPASSMAWAKFVLNEAFIPKSARETVTTSMALVCIVAKAGVSLGDATVLDWRSTGLPTITISKVAAAIGASDETVEPAVVGHYIATSKNPVPVEDGDKGECELHTWGDPPCAGEQESDWEDHRLWLHKGIPDRPAERCGPVRGSCKMSRQGDDTRSHPHIGKRWSCGR